MSRSRLAAVVFTGLSLVASAEEGGAGAGGGGVAGSLEADGGVLRAGGDPKGVRILEQNKGGDPLSEGFLLLQGGGRVLSFQPPNPATGKKEIVSGRVIRSG